MPNYISRSALVASFLLLSFFTPSASGCHQNLHLYRRQRSNTWQSAAQSTNPAVECTVYSYPPIQSFIKTYPTVWEIASLSQPGIDPNAVKIYQQLAPTIPANIPVKGTPQGDFSATTPSYPKTDPDCWWSFGKCTTPKLPGLNPDVFTCPQPSTFGLTIDDGPNCSHNAYYDLLRQANHKATMFYVGSNVIDWPLEAQRGLAEGHEICAHTWSHRYMTGLTNEQAFAELYFSKKIIKDILGVTVQCWRPPFGDVDDRIRYIAASLGMTTILWDNDVNDFRFATLGQAAVNAKYQELLDGASRGLYNTHGTVVLSHELNADTMNTSATYLPKISQAFKYVTPLAVCQNNTQPYIEKSYTYPTFDEWTKGTRTKQVPDPVSNPGGELSLPAINAVASGNHSMSPSYSGSNARQSSAGRYETNLCLSVVLGFLLKVVLLN